MKKSTVPVPTYDEMRALLRTVTERIQPLHHKGYLKYALAYLDAVDENEQVGLAYGQTREQALSAQIAYILSNLNAWSGPEAKAAKASMTAFMKAQRRA